MAIMVPQATDIVQVIEPARWADLMHFDLPVSTVTYMLTMSLDLTVLPC